MLDGACWINVMDLFNTIYIDSYSSCSKQVVSESCSVISNSLWPHGLYKEMDTTERLNWTGLYNPWTSPGQNTGLDGLSLLQGIFPTQGLNTGLPHCRWILYPLSHKGNPRTLEWVAYRFSSRSSQPRNRTGVSCNAGRFFTNWAIKEALIFYFSYIKA